MNMMKISKKPSRLPERRTSTKESGLNQKTLKLGDFLRDPVRLSWVLDPKKEEVKNEENHHLVDLAVKVKEKDQAKKDQNLLVARKEDLAKREEDLLLPLLKSKELNKKINLEKVKLVKKELVAKNVPEEVEKRDPEEEEKLNRELEVQVKNLKEKVEQPENQEMVKELSVQKDSNCQKEKVPNHQKVKNLRPMQLTKD